MVDDRHENMEEHKQLLHPSISRVKEENLVVHNEELFGPIFVNKNIVLLSHLYCDFIILVAFNRWKI